MAKRKSGRFDLLSLEGSAVVETKAQSRPKQTKKSSRLGGVKAGANQRARASKVAATKKNED